jgi:hypothetical protein
MDTFLPQISKPILENPSIIYSGINRLIFHYIKLSSLSRINYTIPTTKINQKYRSITTFPIPINLMEENADKTNQSTHHYIKLSSL